MCVSLDFMQHPVLFSDYPYTQYRNVDQMTIACVHSVLPLPYLSHLVTEEVVVVSEGEAEFIGGKYQ